MTEETNQPQKAIHGKRWCICGHDEWSHHPDSWQCQVEGCSCSRFHQRKERGVIVGDVVQFFDEMEDDMSKNIVTGTAQQRAEQAALRGRADNIPVKARSEREQEQSAGEWTAVKLRTMYIEAGESMQPIAEAINAALAAKQVKVEGLVNTLQFYADEENHVNDVLGMPDGYSSEVEGSSMINQDGGQRAKAALADYGEGK